MTDRTKTTTYFDPINIDDYFIVNPGPSAVWAKVRVTQIDVMPSGEGRIEFVSVGGGRYNRAGTKGQLDEKRFREISVKDG